MTEEKVLEYWLRFYGMPEENIETCITQIAQDYGAQRYIAGVSAGAEAVAEQKRIAYPQEVEKLLDSKISDFELSVRALSCLSVAGIVTVRELVRNTETDLLKFRNFGKRSLAELSEFLTDHNLTWGMKV